MTPAELKDAREKLGLTLEEAAGLLDLKDARAIRRWEAPAEASTSRPVSPRVARLYQAYLSGYRPDDWPERLVGDPLADVRP